MTVNWPGRALSSRCPSPCTAVIGGLVSQSCAAVGQDSSPTDREEICTEAQQQLRGQALLIAPCRSPWFPGQSGALSNQSYSSFPNLPTVELVPPSLLSSPLFLFSSLFSPSFLFFLFFVFIVLMEALVYLKLAPTTYVAHAGLELRMLFLPHLTSQKQGLQAEPPHPSFFVSCYRLNQVPHKSIC